MAIIECERLVLVGATPELLRAEMFDHVRLSSLLNARVPCGWPPEHNDLTTMQYMLDLIVRDEANAPWGYFYVLLRSVAGERMLTGGCGFKGKPDPCGFVEIGYSLMADRQRQGYGTELVAALVSYAFRCPSVTAVVAETMPELVASIRVLEKNGFVRAGVGSEPDSIRYVLRRPTASAPAQHTSGT